MPELILKLGLPRMQNHKVKVGFFWLLKRLNYFFGQLQLYDSGVAFWTMHQGKHGHCDSATKDWVLNHRMRSRPDSGHGAYAGAHRRVVLGRTASWSPKSSGVYSTENACSDPFAKTDTALTIAVPFQIQPNARIPGNTVAD